jgi:hypothetical protein
MKTLLNLSAALLLGSMFSLNAYAWGGDECTPQVTCDACVSGTQTCRVINCNGEVTSTYTQNCQEQSGYSCGYCDYTYPAGLSGGGYSYDVYRNGDFFTSSSMYGVESSCESARNSDSYCQ